MRPCGDHWDPKTACDRSEFRQGIGKPNSCSGEEYRALRAADALKRIRDLLRNLCWREDQIVLSRVIMPQSFGIDLSRLNVDRNIQPARTRTASLSKMPGALEVVRNGSWIVHPHGIFRNATDHADYVDLLVA